MKRKECPICGSKISPIGMGSHKKSEKCLAKAKGVALPGEETYSDVCVRLIYDSGKIRDDSKCRLCGEKIKEEEGVIMLSEWVGSGSNGNFSVIYIHLRHVSEDGELMAKALKR